MFSWDLSGGDGGAGGDGDDDYDEVDDYNEDDDYDDDDDYDGWVGLGVGAGEGAGAGKVKNDWLRQPWLCCFGTFILFFKSKNVLPITQN